MRKFNESDLNSTTDSGGLPPLIHCFSSEKSFSAWLLGAFSYFCPNTEHQNHRRNLSLLAPTSAPLTFAWDDHTAAIGMSIVLYGISPAVSTPHSFRRISKISARPSMAGFHPFRASSTFISNVAL